MRFLSRKTAGEEIKTKDRNVWRGGGRGKKRERKKEREQATWGLKNGRMGTERGGTRTWGWGEKFA